MNLTLGQIFIETVIISSLIIITFSYFSYFHKQKNPSQILFEKNDVFLSEEKDSQEVIFEIVRLREIIKEPLLRLSFFLVVVVALSIFFVFQTLIFKFLKIDIFNLLIEFFNSVVEYINNFLRALWIITLNQELENI